MKTKKTGEKFVHKYGVTTANLYKGMPDNLKIPPPGHPLYDPTSPTTFDPLRVEAIDRDGEMTDPIEVLTDPDTRTMWIVDGRGRDLDVAEVNRRRAAEGREPVEPYIVPFRGDEKAAIARIREKNYHRRRPTPSGQGLDIAILRKAGHGWDAVAKILHETPADPEQWCKKRLPLAYCIPEVRTAVDTGEITLTDARKFGGGAADGSKRLGDRAQAQLLADLRARRAEKKSEGPPTALPPKARARAYAALTNGASEDLKPRDREVAAIVAATLARVGGEEGALGKWPAVEALFAEAVEKKPEKSK